MNWTVHRARITVVAELRAQTFLAVARRDQRRTREVRIREGLAPPRIKKQVRAPRC